MLRYKSLCFFAVFDDGKYCEHFYGNHLNKISGPINRLQALEILVELAFLRVHLSDYPDFATHTDMMNEKSTIIGQRPVNVELVELNLEFRAKLMDYYLCDLKDSFGIDQDLIDSGRLTFLFDDDGNFRSNGNN